MYKRQPLRGLTRPLGEPSGLKGLLHTLNVTVIPTKVSYVCSLAFYFLFLVLLEDEQKIGVGVFVRPLFDHILAHIWFFFLIHFMLNLVELESNYLLLVHIAPKMHFVFISGEIIWF